LRLLGLLLVREWAKAPNVKDQFPTIIGHLMQVAPSGHSGEGDTVFDDVMKLAVTEVLRLCRVQVWHTRIKGLSRRRRTATVAPMTIRASREEILAAIIQILRCYLQWVFTTALFTGNRKIAQGPCDACLKSGWFGGSAKPPVNQQCYPDGSRSGDHKNR
jgi:hypothetical protein